MWREFRQSNEFQNILDGAYKRPLLVVERWLTKSYGLMGDSCRNYANYLIVKAYSY